MLKRSGTWSERYQPNSVEGNEANLMARVFKSQNLTVTWYVNTKTLQIQGSESEERCQYLSKLIRQHTKDKNPQEQRARTLWQTYSQHQIGLK